MERGGLAGVFRGDERAFGEQERDAVGVAVEAGEVEGGPAVWGLGVYLPRFGPEQAKDVLSAASSGKV